MKLAKMLVSYDDPIKYYFQDGDNRILINNYLGHNICLSFNGKITCNNCDKKIRKTYGQGYCYNCFSILPQTDLCIMSPNLCHYYQKTCRDMEWGKNHCMTPHVVYLANSSGPKVGITRMTQVPTRWIDQGAKWAMPIIQTANRREAGILEKIFSSQLSDRTNWRKMLQGDPELVDLNELKENLFFNNGEALDDLEDSWGDDHLMFLNDNKVYEFNYPVIDYLEKIKSINLNKQNQIIGKLLGIKGQYLIFDVGVINIRNYSGYNIEFKEL